MADYNIHTENITVQANSEVPIAAIGTFFRARNATGDLLAQVTAVDNSRIIAGNLIVSNGDLIKFPESFKEIRLRNSTGVNITLALVIGEGDHQVNTLAGTVSVNNQAATTFASSADVSMATASSQDFAADATVRELILQAAQANSGELCVRDQSATTSAGFRLYPGGHIILGNSGAVRVRNNSGATQVLQIAMNKG